jgi:membrane protease subunit HflC
MGSILAASIIGAVLLLYMCSFQVRFTETAIVKTWGRPTGEPITEPGLKFKWPRPIQTVVLYDKRTRILEDRTEETRTVDGKNILLTTYTLWRVRDPRRFHENFPGGERDGENKLRTTIITHKHAVTGQRTLDEFISTDPETRKLREIEDQIRTAVASEATDAFGIEIVDFGVKKLGLPTKISTDIFNAMKANEEITASAYTAEGEARAQAIIAESRAVEKRILAAARQKAAEIQSDAQRVISKYYEEFDQYPELRIFLDDLRTAKEALSSRSTLILDTTDPPFHIFEPKNREAPEAATPEHP